MVAVSLLGVKALLQKLRGGTSITVLPADREASRAIVNVHKNESRNTSSYDQSRPSCGSDGWQGSPLSFPARVLRLVYILGLPTLCTLTAQLVSCSPPIDGAAYLLHDMTVDCPSASRTTALVAGVLCCAVLLAAGVASLAFCANTNNAWCCRGKHEYARQPCLRRCLSATVHNIGSLVAEALLPATVAPQPIRTRKARRLTAQPHLRPCALATAACGAHLLQPVAFGALAILAASPVTFVSDRPRQQGVALFLACGIIALQMCVLLCVGRPRNGAQLPWRHHQMLSAAALQLSAALHVSSLALTAASRSQWFGAEGLASPLAVALQGAAGLVQLAFLVAGALSAT
jgi:hypothetical protein